MSEEICSGCGWKTADTGCVLWKYLNPEICKELKEDLDKIILRAYQSPPLESVNVVRVLCGFDYSVDPEIEPTGTYYKYSEIKSVMRCGEMTIQSRRSITKGEYEASIKEEEKKKKKTTLSQFTVSHNPW